MPRHASAHAFMSAITVPPPEMPCSDAALFFAFSMHCYCLFLMITLELRFLPAARADAYATRHGCHAGVLLFYGRTALRYQRASRH